MRLCTSVLLALCFVAATPQPALPPDSKLPAGPEPLRERDPARSILYTGRGNDLVAAGQFAAALEQFHRAIACDPLNANPLINEAYALDRLGRYELALAVIKRAQPLAPEDPTLYLNWGNTLINLGRFKDALEPLVRATELAPSNHQAQVDLAVSYSRLERPADANAALGKAVQLLLAQALGYGQENNRDKALGCYREIIRLAPQFLPAYVNAAILLEQLGRIDEAIGMLEAALKIAPHETALLESLQKLRQRKAAAAGP